jgi:chitinase
MRLNGITNRITSTALALALPLGTGAACRGTAQEPPAGAGPWGGPAGRVEAKGEGPASSQPQAAPSHLLIGYWHNFVNAAGFIRLRDVSTQFDVVNIAFAVPVTGQTSTITLKLVSQESESDFISDIAFLHDQGKKVVLSIGGANAIVQLNTDGEVQNFVNSVASLVNQFGFDGIDIDFESSSLTLDTGDTHVTAPTTPAIVNLIGALRQLKSTFGASFIISMAPSTFSVQEGFKKYAGTAGVYLPVIFGTRDILSYVYVQDYNTGTRFGLDNKIYTEGTADFHVAMTEMLLQGFPVTGHPSNFFPALLPEQVAFGVTATSLDSGLTSNTDLMSALNYLITGTSFGGQYVLRNPSGYAGLSGLMVWSINWDAANGLSLSNAIGPFLHGLTAGPMISGASVHGKNLIVTGSGFDTGAVILVDMHDERTVNEESDPMNTLIGVKAVKRAAITPGKTVRLQVRNADGGLSNQIDFTRPAQ